MGTVPKWPATKEEEFLHEELCRLGQGHLTPYNVLYTAESRIGALDTIILPPNKKGMRIHFNPRERYLRYLAEREGIVITSYNRWDAETVIRFLLIPRNIRVEEATHVLRQIPKKLTKTEGI